MSPELRAAAKLVSQKIQRCETALKLSDYPRLALEIKNAKLAMTELRQLLTDEPQEATNGR
jgi:hypothetical protein